MSIPNPFLTQHHRAQALIVQNLADTDAQLQQSQPTLTPAPPGQRQQQAKAQRQTGEE
jgi:hypothetical protein